MVTIDRRRIAAAVAVLALGVGVGVVLGTGGGDATPADPEARGRTGGPARSAGGPGPATAGPDATATAGAVIVPGRPGEPARSAPGDQIDPVPDPHNSMDVWFVRMMIPHHTQALRMAALAEERAHDPRVRALAGRIRAGQLPEIQVMRAWLTARHLAAEDPRAGHDHTGMPGMQSEAAIQRLTAARGPEFDRMFIEMMTAHHRGAVTMATELLRAGIDVTVQQFANSIAVEQDVEIDRMRALLA